VDTSDSKSSDATPAEHASDDDFSAAQSSGTQALSDLAAKYPKDPRVLKALAQNLGKDPDRTSELLRVLDSLFEQAPDEANDAELSTLVHNAAVVQATSQRAIEIMRSRMGLHGAEMLFDLMMNEPALRTRARTELETAEAQRNLSPALKIAYDLFTATSCAARADLLPEAIKNGDERTVAVLTMTIAKPSHGCGIKKNKPCPSLCEKEAPAFEAAIKQINDRLAAKKNQK
jgi:threonine synthase